MSAGHRHDALTDLDRQFAEFEALYRRIRAALEKVVMPPDPLPASASAALDPDLITLKEASRIVRKNPSTMWTWANTRDLGRTKIGGTVYVSRRKVEAIRDGEE